MYVCICNSVTDHEIKKAARQGISTMQELSEKLNVATCCGNCAECANNIMKQTVAKE